MAFSNVNATTDNNAPPKWILEKYSMENSFPEKDDILALDKIYYQKIDIDKNGINDWALGYEGKCGSGPGCELDIYAYINNKYCYVGSVFLHEMESSNYINIECRKQPYWLEAKGVGK